MTLRPQFDQAASSEPGENAASLSNSVKKPNIDGLTALRGIAALWVLAHNDSHFRDATSVDAATLLIAKGYLAVDFFLVLSGFVLAYRHAHRFSNVASSAWAQFLLLRLARIYPLYIFLLLVRVGIEVLKTGSGIDGEFQGPPPFEGGNSLSALAANALMIQAWGIYETPTWVPSFWSVSAEWFCYLLFPVLAWGLLSWSKSRTATGIIVAACLAWLAWLTIQNGKLEQPTHLSLLRCIPEFTIGMLLALSLGFERTTSGKAARHVPTRTASPLGVLLSLAMVVVACVWVHFGLFDLVPFLLFCGLIALISCDERVNQFFSRRWLIFLGEISYAVYLSHIIVQSGWRVAEAKLVGTPGPITATIGFSARLILILGISTGLYFLIEMPARRWLRRNLVAQ